VSGTDRRRRTPWRRFRRQVVIDGCGPVQAPIDPTQLTGTIFPATPPDALGSQRLGRGELQDRAVHGAVWTLIHTSVSLPIAFVVNLVIARVLSVAGYGKLAFLTAVMEVAAGVITIGVGVGLIQFGAKAHAAGRRDEVCSLLSAAQGFMLVIEAPLMIILVIAVARISPVLLILAIVFGVLAPAALSGAAACLGIENRTAVTAKIAMASNLLTQIAVLLMALAVGTADAVWATRLVMGGVVVALALFPISRDYRKAVLRPRFPPRFPVGFWRFALPTGLAGIVEGLVVSRTEVFLLTWLSTPVAVGTFALGFGLAGHTFSPAQSLLGPLVPAISGLREVDSQALGRAFKRTLRAGASIVAVLVATALPVLALLVPTLYGAGYEGVPTVAIVLGISGGFLVVASPVQAFVQARLAGARVLKANLTALAVDLALAIALIPVLGVWGAVIANVVGAGTQMGILIAVEITQLELSWLDTAHQSLPVFIGAGACLAAWFTGRFAPFPIILDVLASASTGGLLLLLGLWLTRSGLAQQDAEAIRRVLPGRLQPVVTPLLRCLTHRLDL
jgi:O-antigen/teichoic acid export membrane protein